MLSNILPEISSLLMLLQLCTPKFVKEVVDYANGIKENFKKNCYKIILSRGWWKMLWGVVGVVRVELYISDCFELPYRALHVRYTARCIHRVIPSSVPVSHKNILVYHVKVRVQHSRTWRLWRSPALHSKAVLPLVQRETKRCIQLHSNKQCNKQFPQTPKQLIFETGVY